jgi:hypothetical protein
LGTRRPALTGRLGHEDGLVQKNLKLMEKTQGYHEDKQRRKVKGENPKRERGREKREIKIMNFQIMIL